MLSYVEVHLTLMIVFHWGSSSIKGCLAFKVIFHQWSSFKYFFHQKSSSNKHQLLSKIVFHQSFSSIRGRVIHFCIGGTRVRWGDWHVIRDRIWRGCLPSKVVLFPQRSSSIISCLPRKVVFHQKSSINGCCAFQMPQTLINFKLLQLASPDKGNAYCGVRGMNFFRFI